MSKTTQGQPRETLLGLDNNLSHPESQISGYQSPYSAQPGPEAKWVNGFLVGASLSLITSRCKKERRPHSFPAQLKAASAHGERPLLSSCLNSVSREWSQEEGPSVLWSRWALKAGELTWARKRRGQGDLAPTQWELVSQHSPTFLGPCTQPLVKSTRGKGVALLFTMPGSFWDEASEKVLWSCALRPDTLFPLWSKDSRLP